MGHGNKDGSVENPFIDPSSATTSKFFYVAFAVTPVCFTNIASTHTPWHRAQGDPVLLFLEISDCWRNLNAGKGHRGWYCELWNE